MAFIGLDGKNIYYEEYGKGLKPTVVYFHGGPGESCLTYSYEAKKLGERFHVISFDQYGVFRSDVIPAEQSAGVLFHVDLIEQMRIALGIESWIPLGHSFGGMLALAYAHKYPDSVDAVIYDCPMWGALYTARAMALATLPYFEAHNNSEQKALAEEILADGISPREAFSKALNLAFDEGLSRFCHVIETERYNEYINSHLEDPHVEGECWGRFASFRQKIFEADDFYEDYLPYLAEISKPQFLMVGEYDMTCGKFEQEWFADHVPDGKLHILSNSAHLSWFEHPEEYTELICDFVSGVSVAD